MQCLKCGREFEDGGVFCPSCMETMKDNPVPPGTPVVLPRRDEISHRSQLRSQPKPEEIIAELQRTIRIQRLTMAVSAVVFLVITVALCWLLHDAQQALNIGSNYSTIPMG